MRNSFERLSGYTGGAFEHELLGEIVCGWDGGLYIGLLEKGDRVSAEALVDKWAEEHLSAEAFSHWDRSGSTNRKRLIMDWASDNQPADWDPRDPRHIELNGDQPIRKNILDGDFHDYVAEKMGLEDPNEIEIITTVGTPVDTKWRTDCYLRFKGRVFTIDVTLRDKEGSSGADYVMKIKDPGSRQELEEQATVIAGRFQESIRLQEDNEKRRRVA
ncbi:MAG: hypothetical protein V1704_02090 [Candidatus Vogelbacteria bacterium]